MRTPIAATAVRLLQTLLPVLLVSSVLITMNPDIASAAAINLTAELEKSGTSPFDPVGGPGNDISDTDAVVRTHDFVDFRVTYSTDGGDTNARLVLALPTGDIAPEVGNPIATWEFVPPFCTAGSSISADGQTITCELGNVTNPQSQAIDFRARVLGSAPNGTSIPMDGTRGSSIIFESDDQPTITPAVPPTTALVSAAPRWELNANRSWSGYRQFSGPSGEPGVIFSANIRIFEPGSRKGAEALDGPVTVTFDSASLLPNAQLINWPSSLPAMHNHPDGCNGSVGGVYPLTSNLWQNPRDTDGATSTDVRAVAGGGDCTASQLGGPGTDVTVTLTGTDFSLEHYPLRRGNPSSSLINVIDLDAPSNQFYVASKHITYWVPIADFPLNVTTSMSTTATLSGTSVTGQTNIEPATTGNTANWSFLRTATGRHSIVYGPISNLTNGLVAQRDPVVVGDSHVNYAAPGQDLGLRSHGGNSGTEVLTNVELCLAIDNTRLTFVDASTVPTPARPILASGLFAWDATRGIPADGVVEYGVGGVGGVGQTWGDYNTVTSPYTAPTRSGAAQAQPSCADSESPAWYPTPAALIAAGGSLGDITKVRIRVADLEPNEWIYSFVPLEPRPTYAYTGTDNAPEGGPFTAGDPTNETFAPAQSSFTYDGRTTPHYLSDALEITDTTYARITKTSVVPPNGSNAPVPPGSIVTYQLVPNLVSPQPPRPTDVTVTDVLPPNATFVSGSVTFDGLAAPDPAIAVDTPALGYTTLTWVLPNQTPGLGAGLNAAADLAEIRFDVQVGLNTPDGVDLLNSATVDSERNGFPDCTYTIGSGFIGSALCQFSNRQLSVSSPPGFNISKTPVTPRVEIEQDFSHRLSYASIGSQMASLGMIDVLPFIGDGRGTNFSGLANLVSVTVPANDPGMTVYYTAQAPASLNTDPGDPSHDFTGTGTNSATSTVWCTTAQLGTGDCPLTVGVTTALYLVPGIDPLPAGTIYEVEVTLNGTGNFAGDTYANSFFAASPSLPVVLESPIAITEVVVGEISGTVYEDQNRNGLSESGEPGIPGVTVELNGVLLNGTPVQLCTVTDANGDYSFEDGSTVITDCGSTAVAFQGVLAGTYSLIETQPSAYSDSAETAGTLAGDDTTTNDTISNIVLGVGETGSGYLFGELFEADLAIAKTHSGNFTAGQDGTYTIEVSNLGPSNSVAPITVVDSLPLGSSFVSGGNATWSCTAAGSTITCTSATDIGASGSSSFPITANMGSAANPVVNFVSVDGTTFDPNADNDDDQDVTVVNQVADLAILKSVAPDAPMAGAPVSYTLDVTNNGPSHVVGASITDGLPGDVTGVTWTCTACNTTSGTGNVATTVDLTVGATASITITGTVDATATTLSNTATITPPAGVTDNVAANDTATVSGLVLPASISGTVVDDGTVGIAGVTVTLTGTDDQGATVSVVGTTNPDGTYSFTNLRPGTYTVTETQPVGYGDGAESAGSNGGDDATTNDAISAIVLGSGDDATDYDFAETTSSISGAVYEDLNGNGIRDLGEPGIGGVAITLAGTDDAGSAISVTVPSNTDGTYSFVGLLSGTYTVDEAQPAGYGDGSETAGTVGGDATSINDQISAIALPIGTAANGYLFGEVRDSSISGVVYIDDNNDGVQQLGEAPIGGVTVTLAGTTGAGTLVALSTTTGPAGTYTFPNLAPGTYVVAETQPAGFLDGMDSAGTAGGDATTTNDLISGIVLESNENSTDNNFGELEAASVEGIVVDDQGNPISGVTIVLTGTDENGAIFPVTVVTGTDGTWSFSGLRPGDYTVTESQPTGYSDGTETPGTNGATSTANDEFSVTLASGDASTDNEFTETTSTLSGSVFHDENLSGAQDGAESGIAGVTITLTGTDVLGATVSLSTMTDGFGDYTFDGLIEADAAGYTITESQPSGWLDATQTAGTAGGDTTALNVISSIPVAPGSTNAGYDFGESLAASITGVVLDDQTTGIGGVTMTLTGTTAAGTPIAPITITTNPDGSWSFGNLLPGDYIVAETQPASHGDDAEVPGSNGATSPSNDVIEVTLGSDEISTNNLFFETTGSLSGVVETVSGNPIAGVAISLTGTDVTGAAVSLSTTTAADGSYTFDGLWASDASGYTVVETQPGAYADATDTAGTNGGDATSVNDEISGISLAGGDDTTGYDFLETTGSLVGSVFEDLAGDGSLDPSDPGIGGVTVTLTGTDANGNPVSLSTVTGPGGVFTFLDLLTSDADGYTITEAHPPGFVDGQETVGTTGGDASVNDEISAIIFPAGEQASGYAFGEVQLASISGTVFNDGNNDGVAGSGDTGIAGVTVMVVGIDDLGNNVSISTITAPDGSYSFPGLRPGTYSVVETQPAGFLDGLDVVGSAGGVNAFDDVLDSIVLGSGENATDYDFAELSTGSVSGVVVDDAGLPIAGVTITLTGTDDTGAIVPITVVTNPDGSWSFDGLRPGDYVVSETQPASHGDGPDIAGSNGAVSAFDDVIFVTLGAGENSVDNQFTETTGSISGVVFHDLGSDGVQGPGESGIPGTIVELVGVDINGNSVSMSTITGPDGSYSFVGLLASGADGYTITETQPSPFGDGIDIAGTAGGDASVDDVISAVQLTGGQDAVGYLFAEIGGIISGTVWVDSDYDGVMDADETIQLSGVVITLLDENGTVVAMTTTDTNGFYAFPDIVPGDYTVTQTQPDGFGSTTTNAIDVTATADGVSGVDFGELLGQVGGRVWADEDGDGIDDSNEDGVEGVTVQLVDEDGIVVATTTTDSDGNYSFDDVPEGSYAITIVTPEGDGYSPPDVGSDDTNDSDVSWLSGSTGLFTIELGGCSFAPTNQSPESANCNPRQTDMDGGLVDSVVDLALAKTFVETSQPKVGDEIEWAFLVTNNGNTPLVGALVVDDLPETLSFVSAEGSDWDCVESEGKVSCETTMTLLPGDTAPSLVITTTVQAAGEIVNDGSVSVLDSLSSIDDVPTNNLSAAATTATSVPPLAFSGSDLARLLSLLALVLLFAGSLMVLAQRKLTAKTDAQGGRR